MCVSVCHGLNTEYTVFNAFIHAAQFRSPIYFLVRKDARRMRGSPNVPTAARHISWVIVTGVTFCAVRIYVLGLSAESAADQSAEPQIQRVFPP